MGFMGSQGHPPIPRHKVDLRRRTTLNVESSGVKGLRTAHKVSTQSAFNYNLGIKCLGIVEARTPYMKPRGMKALMLQVAQVSGMAKST